MAAEFAALGRKISQLQSAFDGSKSREIVKRVAVLAKKDVERVAAVDFGGDRAMSNWKRAKLSSGFEVEGDAAILKPRPSGPWKVAESGAAAHTVLPKRRRGRQAALNTPYGFFRSVHVPKTRGHKTWTKSVKAIADETPARVHKEVQRALGEVFG